MKALGIGALMIKQFGSDITPTISHSSLNRTGYKIPLSHKGARNRKPRTPSIAIAHIRMVGLAIEVSSQKVYLSTLALFWEVCLGKNKA